MAPPQVNLNEKSPAMPSQDPLPEKKDSAQPPVIVTVPRENHGRCMITAEQRRQRKRCRVACCISLSFILVMLGALGTACLVYRMKHKKVRMVDDIAIPKRTWHTTCKVLEGPPVPESVTVVHEKKLIYVRPDHHNDAVMEMLHEYKMGLIAFKNSTAKTCYIDRLYETFSAGYERWQGYEKKEHKQDRYLRVMPQKIQIEVVKHIAGMHIYEHCGNERVEYFWVMEVTETEVKMNPDDKYIKV